MELEKQKNLWKKISQSGNGTSSEKPSNNGITMQKSAAYGMQNRNANNSNNKEPMEESVPPRYAQGNEASEDFGEIRPETTPEGYGLRTPYGTHFNLDFLKYCQNIAEGQAIQISSRTPRSRSNSQRSSLISFDSKSDVSGSDKDLSSLDTRAEAEKNIWETKRRLDAFRSFRKKTPSIKDQQQYSSRFTKSVVSNGQRDKVLETDPCSSPVLTSLLNGPIQQQNLQAVREQMAAALTRLKFLENEVKQIQVLQVKISVLQQEKQKLNAELKLYKDSSLAKGPLQKDSLSDRNTSQSDPPTTSSSSSRHSPRTAVPPPPPRRKYKSVAVGPDASESHKQEEALQKLSRVLSRSEMKVVSCDPSFAKEGKDACVGTTTESYSKHTWTEQTELCNSSTSSSDLMTTADAACWNCIQMHDAESQCPILQSEDFQLQVERGDFTVDSCNQIQALCTDKAVLTDHDPEMFAKKGYKDSCVATIEPIQFLPVKHSVGTSTPQVEMDDKAGNTEGIVLLDKASACKPDVAEFGCSAHIRPEVLSSFTETPPLPTKCDAATSLHVIMEDKAGITEGAVLLDKASSCVPNTADFECSVCIQPDMSCVFTETEQTPTSDSSTNTDNVVIDVTENTTNTEIVEKMDKSLLFRPETSDFSSNVLLRLGDVSVSTCTENPVLQECSTNTELPPCLDRAAQVSPAVSDFSNFAKILPPQRDAAVSALIEADVPKVLGSDISSQTELNILKDWYENIVREKIPMRDASTVTVAPTQPVSADDIQSEIGAYVGQVETLLEEQQSLLAGTYKELGDVLDESEEAKPKNVAEKLQNPPNLPQQLIEDLNMFSKDKYVLPTELKSACKTVAKTENSEVDALSVNAALELLKEEWFLLSALQDSRPDYIKDFAMEVRSISQYALTKVVNSLDDTGNSALHYAVSHEDFGLIYTLVDIPELDADQYNNAGYTACMLAAITRVKDDFEVKAIAALFKRADVSLHAKQAGQTALMLAVSHGCGPTAKLLIKAGADVNAQDEDGSTALMCATEHGHIDLVKLLLAHPNCDPTLTDNDGSTAINIAMESEQRDIGVLLYVHRKLDKSQEY